MENALLVVHFGGPSLEGWMSERTCSSEANCLDQLSYIYSWGTRPRMLRASIFDCYCNNTLIYCVQNIPVNN